MTVRGDGLAFARKMNHVDWYGTDQPETDFV